MSVVYIAVVYALLIMFGKYGGSLSVTEKLLPVIYNGSE